MAIGLDELGMTQDELRELVVKKIAHNVLTGVAYDGEEGEYAVASNLKCQLDKQIKNGIDEAVTALADKHVLPNVADQIEALTLHETNKWGEKKDEPVTFIEYLVQRAEAYMMEKVNFKGKSKGEDSYSWTGHQTRITYMVHEHLQYSIEHAMKKALEDANSVIVKGLEATVKMQLAEVSKKLKVAVST